MARPPLCGPAPGLLPPLEPTGARGRAGQGAGGVRRYTPTTLPRFLPQRRGRQFVQDQRRYSQAVDRRRPCLPKAHAWVLLGSAGWVPARDLATAIKEPPRR